MLFATEFGDGTRFLQNLFCHGISNVAYLKKLIYYNIEFIAITGLSAEGQKLLQEESEKYGRGLLRLQQREYGDGMGALRYADTLRLVANSILNAQKHRELVVYLDSVHDKGGKWLFKFFKIIF